MPGKKLGNGANDSVRTAALVLLCLLAFSIQGCIGVPRPFKGQERNERILTSITVNPGVIIKPVNALPPPLDCQIAEKLAQATRDKDVAAATRAAGKSSSILQATARVIETGTNQQEIAIDWQLSSPNGLGTETVTTRTSVYAPTAHDPWLKYANADYTPAIRDVADFLEVALFRPSALSFTPDPQPPASSDNPPYALVLGSVQGAPGNGDRLMAEAMKLVLTSENLSVPVDLLEMRRPGAFVIEARTKKTAKGAGVESISITWTVKSADGDVLGNVAQNNDVARGSLDGDWGDIAFYAAEAAAEGIINILLQFEP